jgi:heterotetrameric sarcosine oxidase gamma subunit
MTLGFLQVDGAIDVAAESPVAAELRAAGAVWEQRDGWTVAASFGAEEDERRAARETVGWADASHLGKLELQGDLDAIEPLPAEPGNAARVQAAWWCRVSATRALVIAEPGATAALRADLEAAAGPQVVDVTTAFAAIVVAGPLARETFARFCALDLRPQRMPVGAVRPGSVARTPGLVVREGEHRFLALFGAALGGYAWTVVADAGARLGGRPIGLRALGTVEDSELEAEAHA